MRMRFEAITRSPASSSFAVIAPVRLRRVASGLMIEKVRSVAMAERSPVLTRVGNVGKAPSRAGPCRQGRPRRSRLAHPAAVLLGPEVALDPVPARQQLPRQPRAFERFIVEQIESAVVAERRLAPLAEIGRAHV